LALIRGGAGGTVLRWVRTLPEDQLVRHPVAAAAAAAAAMLVGGHTLEQRRLLQLADGAGQAERVDPYVEAVAGLVRAGTIDRGVGQAVLNGRRAVALAEVDANANEIITGTLAAYARALFFAGELDEASAVAARALEHPAIERHVPSLVAAYSTLAFVAVERGRLASARGHAREKARAAVGRIGTSRSWLGANSSAALGVVLAAEGTLAEAEAEPQLAAAERFFADEVPTLHHTWLLVLLARVRTRRGRLADAEATLRSARDALGELHDSGPIPALADKVAQELEAASGRASTGELLEPPSDAELAVLRLLATDLSIREIRRAPGPVPRTRSGHTRARSTASSGSTPARTRSPAPPHSDYSRKPNHPGDRPALSPFGRWTVERSRRNYRLIVDLRSQGLAVESVRHAAAAGDQQLVAKLMVEQHLLIRVARAARYRSLGSESSLVRGSRFATGNVGGQFGKLVQKARRSEPEQHRHHHQIARAERPIEPVGVAQAGRKLDESIANAVFDQRQALFGPRLVALRELGGCEFADWRLHGVERGEHPGVARACALASSGNRPAWCSAIWNAIAPVSKRARSPSS
jgi:tetratricopeptide (TPR) repeat protein